MSNLTFKTVRLLAAACFTFIFASVTFSQFKETDLKEKAVNFLQAHEWKLDQIKDDREIYKLLIHLAPAAYYAGETAKAEDYSEKLLAAGKKMETISFSGKSYNGFATHISNMVLGRIAFDKGEMDKAKAHLLAAGKIVANPVLKSFGPNMFLAKQLIEKGERETVLEYFKLCGGFWTYDRGRLEKWKGAVEKGEMPDFGPSLYTNLTTFQVVS